MLYSPKTLWGPLTTRSCGGSGLTGGMWQHRPEVEEPAFYVLRLREAEVTKENGQPKTPAEYLAERAAWDA